MKTLKYLFLSAVLIGFTSCNEDDYDYTPDPEPLPALTTGSLDLSTYVAVGSSFTAGFTDNALFAAGQQNSFTNILSQQFAVAGGGSFSQPLMNDNIGGFLFGGAPNSQFGPRLYFNGSGPTPVTGTPTTEATNNIYGSQGPFNNMGVPGARSFHLVAEGYGNFNPYFGRMASSSTASVLGDAMAQNPTFFTLSEVGGNDVLGYATNGGDASLSTITDQATFDASFNALVSALTSNGAKGVVTNVPYITSLPHFTTVPHNPVPLDAATAGYLNSAAAYGAYNAGIQGAFAYLVGLGAVSQADADLEIAKRTINFSASSNNAVVIMDENLTDLTAINPALVSMRQATAEDLLVLPAMSFIGTLAIPGNPQTVNGVAIPLADKWVLTPEEQLEIKTATDNFNNTIASVASANGLAVVNFRDLLIQASTTGLSEGGFTFTTDFVTGGLVGLDGIHLTSRGYAALANKFLEAIDATYGSNFIAAGVKADIGSYPTNFPEEL